MRRGFFFWTEKRTGCRCMQEVCVVPGMMMMMAELRVFESVKKSCEEESQSFSYTSQFHSLCLISHSSCFLSSLTSLRRRLLKFIIQPLDNFGLSISSCNFSSHCPSSHADERKEKVNIALKLPSLCNSFFIEHFCFISLLTIRILCPPNDRMQTQREERVKRRLVRSLSTPRATSRLQRLLLPLLFSLLKLDTYPAYYFRRIDAFQNPSGGPPVGLLLPFSFGLSFR